MRKLPDVIAKQLFHDEFYEVNNICKNSVL